jgi:hypothetical protein
MVPRMPDIDFINVIVYVLMIMFLILKILTNI